MNVEGVSLEGANQLEMQAEGPNIPLQTFPPGQVTVDVTSEADADLSNYEEIVSSEGEAFYQDYPSAAATPTTSYYMNQLVTIDPAEEETSTDETSQNGGREYFNMVMGFVARK